MSITQIISAIGNNSIQAPLIVRDCFIEAPIKVKLAYDQNKGDKYIARHAVRERIIDEYGTSLVWLGGIPLIDKIAGKIIKKKGFNPNVNLKLFKEDEVQGINKNIEKFKNIAPDAVKDLIKVKNNKKLYETFLASKFFASVAIPIALMGFVLPKLNYRLSKKIMGKNDSTVYSEPSFTGNFAATMANFSTLDRMAMTDGGLAVGRVSTSRNKYEAIDNAVKMSGMLYLNFVAPKQIAKLLDSTTGKLFKLNVNLDPIMLDNNEFLSAIRNGNLKLPKSNSSKDIIDFIDENPDSIFTKFAAKFKKIKMYNEKVRDPRAYVDIKNLVKFKKDIESFKNSEKNIDDIIKFAKRAKFVKGINIISNVVASSLLLAIALPKFQYAVRKIITGSDLEPGLINQ